MKLAFVLFFIFSNTFSSEILFEGKGNISLSKLKELFKVRTIEVYNYSTRGFEKYHAFSMNELLDAKFTKDEWRKSPYIKVYTNTKYAPLIEVYKFQKREAYLAFERADNKSFTTMSGYKDVISDLGPFYLIWKENYKKGAALRRDHWAFGITGFKLESEPPKKFIPQKGIDENIHWGYKNFIKQCIACHTIGDYGSKKDGELISNGLIDKKTDKWLEAFISDPKSVVPKSRMDPFPIKIDGRATRIKNIIKYLRFLSNQKKGSGQSSKSKLKSLNKVLDKVQ